MLYTYQGDYYTGTFISRPNRFLAEIKLEGEVVLAHVKNTGRMTELLTPGKRVYLLGAKNPNRKTKFDLISIEHQGLVVNLDSQIPNKIIEEAFKENFIHGYEDADVLKREYTVGDSRLDVFLSKGERNLFVEVKGVDLLLKDGLSSFPDAPTTRGTKHLRTLERLVDSGSEAMVIFLVVREDAYSLSPNYQTDPLFAQTLEDVIKKGVQARAYKCQVGPYTLEILDRIPILLSNKFLYK